MRTTPATTARLACALGGALATVLAATLGLVALTVPASAAPAPVTEVRPADLARGADIAIPHVVGKRIVDGDVSVKVRGGLVYLIGTSGRSYVVATQSVNGSGGRIQRVTRAGATTVLARVADPSSVTLSTDGRLLVDARTLTNGSLRSVLTARSARTGEVVASRTFAGSVRALAAQVGRVVVGGFNTSGTVSWDLATDVVTRIAPGAGYRADYTHDLLASYSKDPYSGGCTVLRRLSRPGTVLWRSCTERIEEFAPDGRRMTTVDLLSDGIGPSAVGLRNIRGAEIARYRSDFYFGSVLFESADALLLDTYGQAQTAVVRCEVATCERATKLADTPDLRVEPRVGLRALPEVSLPARP